MTIIIDAVVGEKQETTNRWRHGAAAASEPVNLVKYCKVSAGEMENPKPTEGKLRKQPTL